MLLWSLEEAARQLGGVSKRTVQRLIERGDVAICRVGRLVRIPSDSVRDYVARVTRGAHNLTGAESGAWKGNNLCHTDVKTPRFGGSVLPTQAARELDALLAQKIAGKPKRLKPSGSLKRIK